MESLEKSAVPACSSKHNGVWPHVLAAVNSSHVVVWCLTRWSVHASRITTTLLKLQLGHSQNPLHLLGHLHTSWRSHNTAYQPACRVKRRQATRWALTHPFTFLDPPAGDGLVVVDHTNCSHVPLCKPQPPKRQAEQSAITATHWQSQAPGRGTERFGQTFPPGSLACAAGRMPMRSASTTE